MCVSVHGIDFQNGLGHWLPLLPVDSSVAFWGTTVSCVLVEWLWDAVVPGTRPAAKIAQEQAKASTLLGGAGLLQITWRLCFGIDTGDVVHRARRKLSVDGRSKPRFWTSFWPSDLSRPLRTTIK